MEKPQFFDDIPQCFESECAALGSLLLEPERMADVVMKLEADDFYDPQNRSIYCAMVKCFNEGKAMDILTIKSYSGSATAGYIAGLQDGVASASALPRHEGVLKDKHWLRRVLAEIHTIRHFVAASSQSDTSDQIERSLAKLLSDNEKQCGEVSIKTAVRDALTSIEAIMAGGGKMGVPTGFRALDKLTSGLRAGDYWIIAGRPSMGKTSLAMNIVEHAACDKNIPVGILSMEMTADSLIMRMLAARAKISTEVIRTGSLTMADVSKLALVAAPMAKAPIYIDQTPALSEAQMVTRARRMTAKHGIKLLVVDYIQLAHAKVGQRDQRYREVALISGALKQIAKENNIAVLALSQLSRDVEQSGRPPRLSDLRESGSLEQDADLVGLLHNPKSNDDSDETLVHLIVAKHRNGRTGIVELDFDAALTKFKDHVESVPENYLDKE